MYQLLIRLAATRECAWERMYHRKIRGRLGQALKRAGIDRYQESSASPFTFSDLFVDGDGHPGDDLAEGDTVRLLVASTDLGVLEAIASDLQQSPEVTAGSMLFETRAAKPLETGVGDVGDSGTITTASGIVATVAKPGPDESGAPTYWTDRDHSPERFKTALHDSARRILANETDAPEPDLRLFDAYDHAKTYGVKVDATPQMSITLIASKWDLAYEVRDETHRQQLNALLGTGIGSKRSYGFGMLQTRADPGGGSG